MQLFSFFGLFMIALFIFLLGVGLFTVLIFLYWYFKASKLDFPGPTHYPFFGSFFEFLKNKERFYDWVHECSNNYANEQGIVYFSFPMSRPYIFVLKPEYVKHITFDNMENYDRQPIYSIFDELLGKGIFNTDGVHWKNQRRIASHMFKKKELDNNAFKIFTECSNKVCTIIDNHIENDTQFDFKDLMFRLTMDTICKMAFGYEVGCLDADEMPEFAKAIDRCTRYLFYRVNNPLWKLKQFIKSEDEQKYIEDITKLNDLCYEIINKKLQETEENSDILSLFIQKAEITDINYLRDIVFSFIIAGRDTTASSLTWLLYELLKHPLSYEKVEEEVDTIENDITPDKCEKLNFTVYAFKETLRLHPPVPLDLKYAKEDDILADNVKIPKGAIVVYAPYIFGRLESIWGPDFQEFKPSRWENKEFSQYEFLSFNAGKRICLGKPFAILEAKVVMGNLLSKYKFQLANSDFQPDYSLGITSTMDGPLMVKAYHR